MGIVDEIERRLADERRLKARDAGSVLRTSTMTHIVWAPAPWLERARATLAGLADRHPARTILLVPEAGRGDAAEIAETRLAVSLDERAREVVAEVIEIRLRGKPRHRPSSVVLPLLRSDLPVFCRWRGRPAFGATELDELVAICDRFVVDSGEWRDVPRAFLALAELFPAAAVSDIAFARTLAWRMRLADLWPAIGSVDRLDVCGPRAEALLLAGWLRSRLRREIRLVRKDADVLRSVGIDGTTVEFPNGPAITGSELLSAELDRFGRDPVYEGAVLSG